MKAMDENVFTVIIIAVLFALSLFQKIMASLNGEIKFYVKPRFLSFRRFIQIFDQHFMISISTPLTNISFTPPC